MHEKITLKRDDIREDLVCKECGKTVNLEANFDVRRHVSILKCRCESGHEYELEFKPGQMPDVPFKNVLTTKK